MITCPVCSGTWTRWQIFSCPGRQKHLVCRNLLLRYLKVKQVTLSWSASAVGSSTSTFTAQNKLDSFSFFKHCFFNIWKKSEWKKYSESGNKSGWKIQKQKAVITKGHESLKVLEKISNPEKLWKTFFFSLIHTCKLFQHSWTFGRTQKSFENSCLFSSVFLSTAFIVYPTFGHVTRTFCDKY